MAQRPWWKHPNAFIFIFDFPASVCCLCSPEHSPTRRPRIAMIAAKHATEIQRREDQPRAHEQQPRSVVRGLSIHRDLRAIKASQSLTLAILLAN